MLRDAWESGSLFQGEVREAKNSDTGGALVDLGWFAAMVLLYASVLVPLHNPAQCFVLVEYQIHSRHSHISNIYIYMLHIYIQTSSGYSTSSLLHITSSFSSK